MTEDEAKTKVCFKAVNFNASAPYPWSTEEPEEHPARCIGSACMAWRWLDPDDVDENGMFVETTSTGRVPGEVVTERHPGQGFCGLAGAPQ